MACFYEIINIGYLVYRSHDLPWFRLLSWYFLFTSNYYLFGESLIARFRLLLAKEVSFQAINSKVLVIVVLLCTCLHIMTSQSIE